MPWNIHFLDCFDVTLMVVFLFVFGFIRYISCDGFVFI